MVSSAEFFLNTIDEIGVISGAEWNEDSKLIIMSRFLSVISKQLPDLGQQYEKFVQEQADEENEFNTEDEEDEYRPDPEEALLEAQFRAQFGIERQDPEEALEEGGGVVPPTSSSDDRPRGGEVPPVGPG